MIRACTGAPRGAPGQLHRPEASGLDFADAASLALPQASLRQQGDAWRILPLAIGGPKQSILIRILLMWSFQR